MPLARFVRLHYWKARSDRTDDGHRGCFAQFFPIATRDDLMYNLTGKNEEKT